MTDEKLKKCTKISYEISFMEVTEVIKDIIREIVNEEFEDEEPLIMTHRIDSMDIVEIASAMEKKFNIEIEGEEITFDNFDSITKMSKYVSRKLAK